MSPPHLKKDSFSFHCPHKNLNSFFSSSTRRGSQSGSPFSRLLALHSPAGSRGSAPRSSVIRASSAGRLRSKRQAHRIQTGFAEQRSCPPDAPRPPPPQARRSRNRLGRLRSMTSTGPESSTEEH